MVCLFCISYYYYSYKSINLVSSNNIKSNLTKDFGHKRNLSKDYMGKG